MLKTWESSFRDMPSSIVTSVAHVDNSVSDIGGDPFDLEPKSLGFDDQKSLICALSGGMPFGHPYAIGHLTGYISHSLLCV